MTTTSAEREILDHLNEAYDLCLELPGMRDAIEMNLAAHYNAIVGIVATLAMKRIEPEVWNR